MIAEYASSGPGVLSHWMQVQSQESIHIGRANGHASQETWLLGCSRLVAGIRGDCHGDRRRDHHHLAWTTPGYAKCLNESGT
jgi:hypothetical protein